MRRATMPDLARKGAPNPFPLTGPGGVVLPRVEVAERGPVMRPTSRWDASIGLPPPPEIADPVGAARERRRWTPSPTVDQLRPRRDARVSRVVARHQALELEAEHDAALAEVTSLVTQAATPLYCVRRLTMPEHDDVRRRTLRLFAGPDGADRAVSSLAWLNDDRPRSDPLVAGASLRVDVGHLVDDGIGLAGTVHVRCSSFASCRDVVAAGWYAMPGASWHQHAAERVLERGGHEGPGNVHLALGAELSRLAPVLSVMAEAVGRGDPDIQIAVPFGGGLLYGSLDVVQPGVAKSSHVYILAVERLRRSTSRCDGLRAWKNMLGLADLRTWTAMTYLGPDEVGPREVAYAEAFREATAAVTIRATESVALRSTVGAAGASGASAREGYATSDFETGPRHETGYGFDAEVVSALARRAVADGVVRSRPKPREVCASVPVRRRDHDDEPFRRASQAMAAGDARRKPRLGTRVPG